MILEVDWDGETARAERLHVIVDTPPRPTWWCAGIEGKDRRVVRVEFTHGREPLYLDDADGAAWEMVCSGKVPFRDAKYRVVPVREVLFAVNGVA